MAPKKINDMGARLVSVAMAEIGWRCKERTFAPDTAYLVCTNFWRTDHKLVLVKTNFTASTPEASDETELFNLLEHTKFPSRRSAIAHVQIDISGNRVGEICWKHYERPKHQGLTLEVLLTTIFFEVLGMETMGLFYGRGKSVVIYALGSLTIGLGFFLLAHWWLVGRKKK